MRCCIVNYIVAEEKCRTTKRAVLTRRCINEAIHYSTQLFYSIQHLLYTLLSQIPYA